MDDQKSIVAADDKASIRSVTPKITSSGTVTVSKTVDLLEASSNKGKLILHLISVLIILLRQKTAR